MMLNYILAGFSKEFEKLANLEEQISAGKEVEKEHKGTIGKIITDTKNGQKKPLEEYTKSIAKEHVIKEKMPRYYKPWLKDMEVLAKKDKGVK